MKITLDWNTQSIDAWEEKFSLITRSNILQSYTYARAATPLLQQKARWALIRLDDKEAGLVQIFEAGILWNIIHAVMVDRGPLWFDGFGTAVHVKLFFAEMNRLYPKRVGRRRRFLPETEDGLTAQKIIAQTGLVRMGKGYQTIWVDLCPTLEELRANLKPSWRSHLSKAERSNIQIDWSVDASIIEWAGGIHAADKAARDYTGISTKLFSSYAALAAENENLHLARAIHNGEVVAFTATIAHGRSATYLIGWSSDAGRKVDAHTLLLWETMARLKNKDIKEFDLGGINDDENAAGIKTFKEGLGGRTVRYVGHYS